MKLYEINEEIQRLTDQIGFDEETGELLGDAEDLLRQIDSLQMERKSILEYLAKLVLNLRAEEVALKGEEARLKDRRSRLEKKEGRLLQVLDRECHGEKTDLGIGAYIEYEPLKHNVTPTDNTSLMEWRYAIDEHTNDPVFRREYTSVLQANRADGVTMRNAGEIAESQVVKRFNRASVGIRISISLWSVPLDFGTNYRKQQKYNTCMCDFFYN